MKLPTSCPLSCPDHERLRQLLESDLANDEEAELVRHLDSCSGCQQSLEEIAGDASFAAVGAASDHDKPVAASAFWPVLEQLERDVGATIVTPKPLLRDLS